MSPLLIMFSKSFVLGRLSADVFSEAYVELWRIERDQRGFDGYCDEMRSAAFSLFCCADMYNPSEGRTVYEFDEEKLRSEVFLVLNSLA
jgi:hypothetical protein